MCALVTFCRQARREALLAIHHLPGKHPSSTDCRLRDVPLLGRPKRLDLFRVSNALTLASRARSSCNPSASTDNPDPKRDRVLPRRIQESRHPLPRPRRTGWHSLSTLIQDSAVGHSPSLLPYLQQRPREEHPLSNAYPDSNGNLPNVPTHPPAVAPFCPEQTPRFPYHYALSKCAYLLPRPSKCALASAFESFRLFALS